MHPVSTPPGAVNAMYAAGMAKGMARQQSSGSDVLRLSDGGVPHSTIDTAPRRAFKPSFIVSLVRLTPTVAPATGWCQNGKPNMSELLMRNVHVVIHDGALLPATLGSQLLVFRLRP